ncbi:PREDICTED: inositol-pentakisphosphate 2-kinase [Dufourea novaeangliae]|uniref:Inositol-pentakisphosphate 2-kinase n=1 Tax=Dufourea novaeangliae TaxID=178035 RepID=A0A154PUL2_DUFNO|nr:PREDICTED: inositol-pentakisphosphate 2-kinase [Dufourea novaeangliae]KZC14890.1 Inositol-pentakisphosphate 2-kinase [Dufourea novaeangliae]
MRISEGNPAAATMFSSESMTTSTGSSGDVYPASSELPFPPRTFSVEDSVVYRGEGNANVVIALSQERKVIRFRKSLPDDVPPDGGRQRAEREVEFVRSVASCFLGPYTQIPEILRCDAKDIARLSEAIQTLRPEKRRDKNITETYATKFPDYTFLRTKHDPRLFRGKEIFSVEIKPKQGYSRDDDRKLQKCSYCLMQYYKLKKKVITSRSSYCPFDLFSGVEERMKSALKGLLASPQNNLKIFRNGVIVYNQESSSSDLERVLAEWFRNSPSSTSEEYTDEFYDLIYGALLCPFSQEGFKPSAAYEISEPARRDFEPISYINPDVVAKAKKLLYFSGEACNLQGETLPNNSVLERILHVQKLPFITTEYVYNIYSTFRLLLKDDIVYNNLIKAQTFWGHRKFSYKSTKSITESAKTLKDTPWRTCITGTHTPNRTTNRHSYTEHRNVNSEFQGTTNNDRIKSVLVPGKSNLLPTYLGDNDLLYGKSDVPQNEGNGYCTEAEANCCISSEDILCLQNYLLFSCARDCSILIAFRELNTDVAPASNEGVIKLSNGLSFLCDIGISDLDPKSLRCIEKHRQRDTDVLNSVISVLEEDLMLKNHST